MVSATGIMNMICGPLFNHLARATDTELDRSRKKFTCIIAVAGLVVGASVWLARLQDTIYSSITVSLCIIPSIVGLGFMLWTKAAPALLLECMTYAWVLSLLSASYVAIQQGTPTRWPFIVIFLDLSLVNQLGRRVTTVTLTITCVCLVWFQAMSAAEVSLPGGGEEIHVCDCEDPPCRVGSVMSFTYLVQDIIILLLDFYLTRGFAVQVLEEKTKIQTAIDTAEDVAVCLGAFDLDAAEALLQAGRPLPEGLTNALHRLLQNLRAYRPYLPAILLEQVRGETEPVCQPVAAPGTVTEEAAIVFTDVRASTSIWEAVPEAMKKAMQTHNAVMRKAAAELGGYEVKTIGDAFMVAFEGVCAGVDFGLAVQEHLLDADWPPALLDHPICRPTALWGGLTVRVGVNHGPLTVEANTVTGRVDYFGHTVNVAARLEGVCVPGAVAMLYDTWAQVNTACQPAVAGAAALKKLKGVSASVYVCTVWPQRLRDREYLPLNTMQSAPPVHDVRSLSSFSDRSMEVTRVLRTALIRDTDATAAAMTLCKVDNSVAALRSIGDALEAVMPLLQQSGGTLVTLLGERVFVGWNLVRRTPAHAEGALRFAQRALRIFPAGQTTIGLATGVVYHGDVGTTTQRFVTASGWAVDASLQMWRLAWESSRRCLYTAEDVLVGAARELLRQSSTAQMRTATATEITEHSLVVYELQESLQCWDSSPEEQLG